MAKTDEEERRERLELLKMKQGMIEDSDIIPEEAEKPVYDLTPRDKAVNFFYYYKWILLIGILAASVLIYLIIQTVTREKEDIRVLLIDTGTGISNGSLYTERALEKLCPDFNGNGKTHVGVCAIDISVSEAMGQYYISQMQLFDNELLGTACIVVSDAGFWDYMMTEVGTVPESFLNIRERYPDAVTENDYSVPASGTTLEGFPEYTVLYLLKVGRDDETVENSVKVFDAIMGKN